MVFDDMFDDMFSRFDTIPACDGRTDRQTSCYSIIRAMHIHRAVKTLLQLQGLCPGLRRSYYAPETF